MLAKHGVAHEIKTIFRLAGFEIPRWRECPLKWDFACESKSFSGFAGSHS